MLAGYVDPAKFITADSYRRKCSTDSNNGAHSAGPWVATTQMESAFHMRSWVADYVTATRPGNVSLQLLWELSKRKGVYALNPDRNQTFFDFINLKIHVLDALEQRIGARDLWRPDTTMLDVGCGHAFLAGYLQARYRVRMKGYDIGALAGLDPTTSGSQPCPASSHVRHHPDLTRSRPTLAAHSYQCREIMVSPRRARLLSH